jgi:hypothetical protein
MTDPNNNQGSRVYDLPSGLIKRGVIVGTTVNANTTLTTSPTMSVRLDETNAQKNKVIISVPATFPLIDNSGLFIGSVPTNNTPVTICESKGGEYFFINYAPKGPALIPKLDPGTLLISSSNSSKITLNIDSNINIGSQTSNIHIFAGSQKYPNKNLITINFDSENHFNQAYREIAGAVKRDVHPNMQAAAYSGRTKLEDDSYDQSFTIIGMDPSTTANNLVTGPNKNPPFVEHREIVYEFQYKSDIEQASIEAAKYGIGTAVPPNYTTFATPNRRASRADTMSLTLLAPNYLIEKIEGTVVDIFGNILDLNRQPLQIGQSSNSTTLQNTNTSATFDPKTVYANLAALERRSIAYHFELNARKDLTETFPFSSTPLTMYDDNYNAKLLRSRFSFDIDKEGQFKLNVPASSNAGNIPLLVRPENYSTFAKTDNENPNQLWFYENANNTSQDIFVDSFAAPAITMDPLYLSQKISKTNGVYVNRGSIAIQDASTPTTNLGPPDRLALFPHGDPTNGTVLNIKHGTAHHDVLQTCNMHQNLSLLDYRAGTSKYQEDISYISALTNIVHTTINVGTVGATPKSTTVTGVSDIDEGTSYPYTATEVINGNAGGRSGSINLDGSLDLNIGANVIDRQSLWMDTAGGVVANIGRDVNQRSLMMNMDGDAFIQIGGYGLGSNVDARFAPLGQESQYNGTFDIRVYNNGFTHIIRVDNKGLLIMTPGRIAMHASSGMSFISDANITIDCENLIMQERAHKKVLTGSS